MKSIRAKLFLLVALLLAATCISYLFVAISLFRDDKLAYVFDSSAQISRSLATNLEQMLAAHRKTLEGVLKDIAELSPANSEGPSLAIVNKVITKDSGILALRFCSSQISRPKIQKLNDSAVRQAGISSNSVAALVASPESCQATGTAGFRMMSRPIGNGGEVIEIRIHANDPKSGERFAMTGWISPDTLQAMFGQARFASTYAVNLEGQKLHKLTNQGTADHDKAALDWFSKQKESTVGEVALGRDERYIVALTRVPSLDFAVIAETPLKEALRANDVFALKILRFAAFIALAAFWISLIFSGRITRYLRQLVDACDRIGQGIFDVQVEVRSRDEISILAQAFNRMSAEILRLLAEVKIKARMESELETAKLVQETLFPPSVYSDEHSSVCAFYQPASECGGDWCGYFRHGSKTLFLIGDATGHGVPSALITATAQSTCSTLVRKTIADLDALPAPGALLGYLNDAVWEASRGHIKMTFCAALVDWKARSVVVSNASHEMPFIFSQGSANDAAAVEITPLGTETQRCLGDEAGQKYQEQVSSFPASSVLLFYTDGIVEARNEAGDEWGERRMCKTMQKNWGKSPEQLKDSLMQSLETFSHVSQARDDDITFMVATAESAG